MGNSISESSEGAKTALIEETNDDDTDRVSLTPMYDWNLSNFQQLLIENGIEKSVAQSKFSDIFRKSLHNVISTCLIHVVLLWTL